MILRDSKVMFGHTKTFVTSQISLGNPFAQVVYLQRVMWYLTVDIKTDILSLNSFLHLFIEWKTLIEQLFKIMENYFLKLLVLFITYQNGVVSDSFQDIQ